jgi:oxalate decarboxylase
LSFDNGAFSEHGTFSITDWINVTPKDMLANEFGVPKDVFDASRKAKPTSRLGPFFPPRRRSKLRGPRSRRISSAFCTITGRCAISMAAASVWPQLMNSRRPNRCRAV